jgi:hypothetical protein
MREMRLRGDSALPRAGPMPPAAAVFGRKVALQSAEAGNCTEFALRAARAGSRDMPAAGSGLVGD